MAFPKEVRLLRRADFERVYKEGFRIAGPYFAAFCLRRPGQGGPKVGLTAPRSLGKSTVRNRIKRRLREAVRLNLWRLGPEWAVVFHPRLSVLEASFEELQHEVRRVFSRCA
ncbi:MAG: ribonuclease P protein component [Bryobacterales bacterium]|nr:ribonuclease P protein component [Bryobacteraceae bacterium]MDW8353751.1 ribonuclease P protein component [Bryobacterales bacterium]